MMRRPGAPLFVSRNLSDRDLFDLDYSADALTALTALRRLMRQGGGDVLVRSATLPEYAGFRQGLIYGVYVRGDFPMWRGTLGEAASVVARLVRDLDAYSHVTDDMQREAADLVAQALDGGAS